MKSLFLYFLLLSSYLCVATEISPSRNIDPNYYDNSYETYLASHPEQSTVYRQISPILNRELTQFLIVVENDLYPDIQNGLNSYQENLVKDNINGIILTFSGTSYDDLRNILRYYYYNYEIFGALLVGDLPLAWFELFEDWNHSGSQDENEEWVQFPADIFFADMDGDWRDVDENGIYDEHSGNTSPEIIVGRLKADNLDLCPESEVNLINNYFEKNDQFRNDLLQTSDSALLYLDDDWQNYYNDTMEDLEYAFSNVVLVNDEETTTTDDYSERLSDSYDLIQVNVHSNPYLHSFTPGNSLTNEDLINLTPNALIYNLFACSSVNLAADNNLGSIYLLNNDYSQVVVGTSKSGGMLYYEEFYHPIIYGGKIGENFKNWWIAHVDTGADYTWQRSWFYGMLLLGDPCLKLKNPNATFVCGEVSGNWTEGNSPYIVTDDITIENGEELEIGAGCQILFLNSILFQINGKLLAEGTENEPISFRAVNENANWRGMWFDNNSSNENSRLNYCKISDARKSGYPYVKGGGIFLRDNSSLSIENSEIVDCFASYSGGGLCLENSTVIILNSTISNCSSNRYGGGISLMENSEIICENNIILNNEAKYGGGIAFLGSDFSISNIIISDNYAEEGGGIYVNNQSELTLTNVKISRNHGSGGGIFAAGNINLNNVSITNNIAEYQGGGVRLSGTGNLNTANSVSIYNNIANIGFDLYAEFSNNILIAEIDTFSVQYPTSYYVYPINNFDLTISNYIKPQTDENIYVSPDGDNMNSGLSPSLPVKNIREAFGRLLPTSMDSIRTIHLDSGIYSGDSNGEYFPLHIDGNISLIGASRDSTIIYPDNPVFEAYEQTEFTLEKLTIERDANNHLYHIDYPYPKDIFIINSSFTAKKVKLITSSDMNYVINCNNSNVILDEIHMESASDQSDQKSYIYFGNTELTVNNSTFSNIVNPYEFLKCQYSNVELNNLVFDSVPRPLWFNESTIDLDNILIKNGLNQEYEYGGLLSVKNSGGTIKEMTIKNNQCAQGAINFTNNSDSLIVTKCLISGNTSEQYAGLYFINSTDIMLENVTVKNNMSFFGSNIFIQNSKIDFSSDNRCNIYNNYSLLTPSEIFTDSFVELFVDTFTVAIPTEAECAPLEYFTFDINNIPPQSGSVDLYVSLDGNNSNSGESPDDPLKNVLVAISRINPTQNNPLTIHLAPGTYNNSNTLFPIIGKDYLTISGEGMGETIIDSDHGTCFNILSLQDAGLSNLTVLGNCDNESLLYCDESTLYLERINFSLNIAGNGNFYIINSNVSCTEVKWHGNENDLGGAINCQSSTLKLTRCSFSENLGGTMGGAIYLINSELEAFNTIFDRNYALLGNTIYSENTNLYFDYCVFMGNDYSGSDRSELDLKYGDVYLQNTIVKNINGKLINYIEDSENDSIQITYSNIFHGELAINYTNAILFYGENNIDNNPLFYDYTQANYLLLPNSPCIDTGDPSSSFDIEDSNNSGFALWPSQGTTRSDMGIYGGPFCAIFNLTDATETEVPVANFSLCNYPNPFNPTTVISFQVSNISSYKSSKIEIFNIKGQKVKQLVSNSANQLSEGQHSVVWDGRDKTGRPVSSGVYLYTLKLDGKIVASRKMLFLK